MSGQTKIWPINFQGAWLSATPPTTSVALNTHGRFSQRETGGEKTGACLEHGSRLSSGEGQAGVSPKASGQGDQIAERSAATHLEMRFSVVREAGEVGK